MADKDAATGQSVIVITHDVESKLIDQCDRLIVLQPGGKMAYFGPPGEGLRYFGADDWADVFQAVRRRAGARLRRRVPGVARLREVRGHPDLRPPAAARRGAAGGRGERPGPSSAAASSQVFTMARRYRRVMQADRVFIATTILMPILLGALVRATPDALRPGQRRPRWRGLNVNAIQMVMILVMSSVLAGTALSIREFIKERDIYERERMAGLSASAYLLLEGHRAQPDRRDAVGAGHARRPGRGRRSRQAGW